MCHPNPVSPFKNLQALLTVLCGLALAAGVFLQNTPLPYLSVLFGSYFAVCSTWESIKRRELDVNFLMVFAAVGAVTVGRPLEAGGLLFLFSLSSTLEVYAMSRTRSAIEGLVRLRPDQALRVKDGAEERVPVESLEVGDRVIVSPFEQIPVDGYVLEGTGTVNQSVMTGESEPVTKAHGDPLIGGTQNLESLLTMEVSARVSDGTLTKIVALVQDAQENKASGEQISSWFGQRYTWIVLLAFVISIAYHLALPGNFAALGYATARDYALYKSLTLLVALSPCALVISTPATTLSALAAAARRGILVRGGRYIELAGQVKAIALDKTGTLTAGRPELYEICVCEDAPVTVGAACEDSESCWRHGRDMSSEALQVLSAAASAEQYSDHPMAEAIVRAARERGLNLPEADERKSFAGLGVTANIHGMRVAVGRMPLFESLGIKPPEDFLVHAYEMARKGMSVAMLSYGEHFAALGLRDAPRANAAETLARLDKLGVKRQLMVSGDNEQTVMSIAKEVGMKETHAGLMPDSKETLIAQLEEEEGSVMMVGDGVNDAPSLARATVGVAMGGLGSDIALNSADIVLMHDDLDRIPEIVELGRRTNRIIRTNLIFATAVIATLAVTSLVTVLRLPIAVVGHEGSTVLVILNGLRLLGHGPSKAA